MFIRYYITFHLRYQVSTVFEVDIVQRNYARALPLHS